MHTPSEMVGLVSVQAGTDGEPSPQSAVSLAPSSTVRSSSIRNRSILSPGPSLVPGLLPKHRYSISSLSL